MQTEDTASKLLYEDRTSIVLGQGSFIRGLQLTIRQTTHRGGQGAGGGAGVLGPTPNQPHLWYLTHELCKNFF
jgi:hypothetical protein